jgi:hypothetical protein
MSDIDKPDYEIGWGKPPRANRYKPGESGNKNGRPPSSKTVAKVMEKELKKRIRIRENGKSKTITKLEAILLQVINKAASGDRAMVQLILQHLKEAEAKTSKTEVVNQEDQSVAQGMLDRIKRAIIEAAESSVEPPATVTTDDPKSEEGEPKC